MKYVHAGYLIALSVLFLFAIYLFWRWRRLESASALVARQVARNSHAADLEPTSTGEEPVSAPGAPQPRQNVP